MGGKNYYNILQVSSNATQKEIKSSYRKLVLQYHPDKNQNINDDKIKEINEAYNILSNNEKKK